MELKRVRCTQCGAEFDRIDIASGIMKCERIGCGATFFIEQGAAFADVEDAKAEKIAELREALAEAVDNKRFELSKTRAADIQALLPRDFMAHFCLALADAKLKSNPQAYENLLSSPDERTETEAKRAVEIAFSNFELHSELAISNFIRRHFIADEKEKLLLELSEISARRRMKDEDYANIPRDVFLCHSSSDAAVADFVYNMIVGEGFSCWSSRVNLPPDTRDYQKRIDNAIENCRLMVVISSEQCMLRSDPRSEIETALRMGKPLVEFKIDKKAHTEAFKYYFKGNQWVEGFLLNDEQYKALMRRIAKDLIGRAPAPEPASAPVVSAPKPKQVAPIPEAAPVVINPSSILTRAKQFLEDGDKNRANEYIERALDADATLSDAYLLKTLLSLGLKRASELETADPSFQNAPDFQRAVRFAEGDEKRYLVSLAEKSVENDLRIKRETAKREFAEAKSKFNAAASIADEKSAIKSITDVKQLFKNISHPDSAEMIKLCDQRIARIKCSRALEYAETVKADRFWRDRDIDETNKEYKKALETLADHKGVPAADIMSKKLYDSLNIINAQHERVKYPSNCLNYKNGYTMNEVIAAFTIVIGIAGLIMYAILLAMYSNIEDNTLIVIAVIVLSVITAALLYGIFRGISYLIFKNKKNMYKLKLRDYTCEAAYTVGKSDNNAIFKIVKPILEKEIYLTANEFEKLGYTDEAKWRFELLGDYSDAAARAARNNA